MTGRSQDRPVAVATHPRESLNEPRESLNTPTGIKSECAKGKASTTPYSKTNPTHSDGAEFELKEVSKRLFLDFFGEQQNSERRQRAGIYDARVLGPEGQRVQIILLDTRTFRGPFKRDSRGKKERAKVGAYLPHNDAEATILGDAQWAWLERQLRKPAEVRLVCSSTQIVPDAKGMDEWGCFPLE